MTLAHFFWGAPEAVLAGKGGMSCSDEGVWGEMPWAGGRALEQHLSGQLTQLRLLSF